MLQVRSVMLVWEQNDIFPKGEEKRREKFQGREGKSWKKEMALVPN